jgi:hypothetical protein
MACANTVVTARDPDHGIMPPTCEMRSDLLPNALASLVTST